MPRLFTGLEIPSDIALSLSMMRGGMDNVRWIEPEDYHITLRFIGDVSNLIANELADAFSRIERQSFQLRLSGLDAFGGNKPRSIFAKVERCEALSALQREHEMLCQRLGLEPEARKYAPHVTLARLRAKSSLEAARYLSLNGGFSTEAFFVKRFVLYSARESTGGGPYVIEETFDLTS